MWVLCVGRRPLELPFPGEAFPVNAYGRASHELSFFALAKRFPAVSSGYPF